MKYDNKNSKKQLDVGISAAELLTLRCLSDCLKRMKRRSNVAMGWLLCFVAILLVLIPTATLSYESTTSSGDNAYTVLVTGANQTTVSNGWGLFTFYDSLSQGLVYTDTAPLLVYTFVVAGGGGGGSFQGGGGGAGGVVQSVFTLFSPTVLPIVVGTGGGGGMQMTCRKSCGGCNGGNSSVGSSSSSYYVSAVGGGGGGCYGATGSNGGSGGGGVRGSYGWLPGTGMVNQGS